MLDTAKPVTARPAIPGGMVPTLAVLICLSAAAIDVSMPALPVVAGDLGAAIASAQLAISFYLAGYAIGQIPIGLLADRFGRLPPLYGGLAVFILAGAVATVAERIDVLLVARLVQGLAGACGPLLARTIIRDTAEGTRLSQLMSLMVTVLGVTTLAAPIVGAALTELFGWRSTFAASVVLGLVLLALVRRYVPETRPASTVVRRDLLGQVTASARQFVATPQCLWGSTLVALAFGGYMAIVVSASPVLVNAYGFPVGAVGPIFAVAVLAYIGGAWASRRLVGAPWHRRPPRHFGRRLRRRGGDPRQPVLHRGGAVRAACRRHRRLSFRHRHDRAQRHDGGAGAAPQRRRLRCRPSSARCRSVPAPSARRSPHRCSAAAPPA